LHLGEAKNIAHRLNLVFFSLFAHFFPPFGITESASPAMWVFLPWMNALKK
jgi:hypothetical protein